MNIFEAAKCLDKYDPDWYNKINLDTLNMKCYSTCVVGQLTGLTSLAFQHKCMEIANSPFVFAGPFGHEASNSEWKQEIQNRRNVVDSGNDFVWAMKQMKEGKRVKQAWWKESVWFLKDNKIVNNLGYDIQDRLMTDFLQQVLKNNWVLAPKMFSSVELGQNFTFKNGVKGIKVHSDKGLAYSQGNFIYHVEDQEVL